MNTNQKIGDYSVEAIENRLLQLPKEIYDLSIKAIKMKEDYLTSKADYELGMAKAMIMEKATNPEATQTDIKAIAIEINHQKRLDMIVKEAEYKRLTAEMRQKQNGLESIKELSYLRRTYIS